MAKRTKAQSAKLKSARADDVVRAIQRSLGRDWLTVPECKFGPYDSARIDLWAMRKSWANQGTRAYEVKVSRADFLRDQKWEQYLKCASEMWFVAPAGVIDPAELPEGVGLARYTPSGGGRIITVRKAAPRPLNHEALWDLVMYVLMWRVAVRRQPVEVLESDDDETPERGRASADYWRAWLKNKRDLKDVGWRVSQGLRKQIESEVQAAQRENDRIRKNMESLVELRDALDAAGIRWQNWLEHRRLLDSIRAEAGKTVAADAAKSIDSMIQSLWRLKRDMYRACTGVELDTVPVQWPEPADSSLFKGEDAAP